MVLKCKKLNMNQNTITNKMTIEYNIGGNC